MSTMHACALCSVESDSTVQRDLAGAKKLAPAPEPAPEFLDTRTGLESVLKGLPESFTVLACAGRTLCDTFN